jgi:hypothetical protein
MQQNTNSFPFLRISKHFDIPYERVLQAAEQLRQAVAVSPKFSTMPDSEEYCALDAIALDAIENAVLAENERRTLIKQYGIRHTVFDRKNY